MVMEYDQNLGGRQAMQYTDHVSQKCTLETYIMLLTNVTSIYLIKKNVVESSPHSVHKK